MKESLYLLRLVNYPILDQLRLEEALLRTDRRNWCIVNAGSTPAIVMGISGQLDQIDAAKMSQCPLPVIKRFSGGGTVVVDTDTLFVSLLLQKGAIESRASPQEIMRWSANLYSPLLENFALIENDYVIGKKKFGGNAQYICKGRYLHHSSLLWDYNCSYMDYLHLPEKRPIYRKDRPHERFLCRLKDLLPCRYSFLEKITRQLAEIFTLIESSLSAALQALDQPHRRVTLLYEKRAVDRALKARFQPEKTGGFTS